MWPQRAADAAHLRVNGLQLLHVQPVYVGQQLHCACNLRSSSHTCRAALHFIAEGKTKEWQMPCASVLQGQHA